MSTQTMTKAQEIAALRAFAESLPMDSYLRPWLTDAIPTVERDIYSDLFPSPYNPGVWRYQTVAAANDEAHAIVTKAKREAQLAEKERERSMADAARHWESTVGAIKRSLKALGAE